MIGLEASASEKTAIQPVLPSGSGSHQLQQDAEFGNMVDIVLSEHDSDTSDIEIDPDI